MQLAFYSTLMYVRLYVFIEGGPSVSWDLSRPTLVWEGMILMKALWTTKTDLPHVLPSLAGGVCVPTILMGTKN